jgi:hypothetical protein
MHAALPPWNLRNLASVVVIGATLIGTGLIAGPSIGKRMTHRMMDEAAAENHPGSPRFTILGPLRFRIGDAVVNAMNGQRGVVVDGYDGGYYRVRFSGGEERIAASVLRIPDPQRPGT